MLDVKITGGTLLDGTGRPGYRAEIGIRDGIITEIAPKLQESAREVLDAEGLCVTPGFLDTHAHSDDAVFFRSDGYNCLEQGITTQLVGNCGDSPAPYRKDCGVPLTTRPAAPERLEEMMAAAKDCPTFLAAADRQEKGINYAFLVGHNALRLSVMGESPAAPTPLQLQAMQEQIRLAMRAGYFGYSSGLVYAPSVYADTAELTALAKASAEFGGLYASHIRGEGDHVLEAVREAIAVGRGAGCPVLISHIKVMGPNRAGKAQAMLRMIREANAEGVRVFADQYPYDAGSAPLISQIPPKYLREGRAALLQRLEEPQFRRQVEHSIFHETEEFESCLYYAGYAGSRIAAAAETPEAVGKTLTELAAAAGVAPVDAMAELLLRNHGTVQGVYTCMQMEDIRTFLADENVYAGTDWSAYPEHYSEEQVGGGHPRGTGAMFRRIELCREFRLRSPEACIRSMTGAPAGAIGLRDRGLLRPGLAADLCVLDWERAAAEADDLHPFRRNRGLAYVLLNGTVAVRGGRATGCYAGQVLRHAPVK